MASLLARTQEAEELALEHQVICLAFILHAHSVSCFAFILHAHSVSCLAAHPHARAVSSGCLSTCSDSYTLYAQHD